MARILVDATGPPATRAAAPAVRAVLARLWRPQDVLDVPAEAQRGAGALAAECWTAWAGTVTRPPLPTDVEPEAAEAIRAGERLHGDVRGVLLFTTDQHQAESMLTALARLAGVAVHTVPLS